MALSAWASWHYQHLRPVRGVLPAALAARDAGRCLVVALANAEEACLATGLKGLCY